MRACTCQCGHYLYAKYAKMVTSLYIYACVCVDKHILGHNNLCSIRSLKGKVSSEAVTHTHTHIHTHLMYYLYKVANNNIRVQQQQNFVFCTHAK